MRRHVLELVPHLNVTAYPNKTVSLLWEKASLDITTGLKVSTRDLPRDLRRPPGITRVAPCYVVRTLEQSCSHITQDWHQTLRSLMLEEARGNAPTSPAWEMVRSVSAFLFSDQKER